MTTYLLILIVALQLADIVTTYLAITRQTGAEANKRMARWMERFGLVPTLLATKGFFVAWVIGMHCLAQWLSPDHPLWLFALACISGGYLQLVVHNTKVLTAKVCP